MTGRELTLDTLRKAGACREQVQLAKELFGDRATVTVELCASVADKFDWDWAAHRLLSSAALDAYSAAGKAAQDAYNAAIKSAQDAYDAVVKPARDAYRAAAKATLDAYNAATKATLDAYNAATKAAWDAYSAARTKAFADAYISDGV